MALGSFDYSYNALLRDETGKEAVNAGRVFGSMCSPPSGLDDEELKDWYFQCLWTPAGCNRLPLGLDYLIFDGAYRFGIEPCVFWLQLALKMEPTGTPGLWQGRIADKEVDPVIEYFSQVIQRRLRCAPEWNSHKYWLSNRHQRAILRARKLAARPQVLNAA